MAFLFLAISTLFQPGRLIVAIEEGFVEPFWTPKEIEAERKRLLRRRAKFAEVGPSGTGAGHRCCDKGRGGDLLSWLPQLVARMRARAAADPNGVIQCMYDLGAHYVQAAMGLLTRTMST